LTETIAAILEARRSGAMTPADTVARSYARIRAHDDPALFISLRDEQDAVAEAKTLMAADRQNLPLYGIPVAIKDNIDAEGLPTTAACPAYAYRPVRDATAVAKLRQAGAIVVGNGTRPAVETRPQLGFRPTILLSAAGTPPEPDVSVPRASGTSPAATAVAEPELEPPGISAGSRALRGMP
jgi:hypothetical protein